MRKYTLYAIGEIALVVIGILIALSINNWNENQKDRKTENKALINLKLEFDENQRQLDALVIRRKKQEKDCRTYINLITDTTIPISQKIAVKRPSGNYAIWGVTFTVLNSLLNTGGIDRIQNDSLRFLLTKWPSKVEEFKQYEARFVEGLRAILNYEDLIIPRSTVKEGNYRGDWPGNYYPPSMAKKLDPIRTKLVDDIKYYNLFASLTTDLYIYSMSATDLRDNYELISQLIIDELKNRGIQIPRQ
jgi:hypothetical protein